MFNHSCAPNCTLHQQEGLTYPVSVVTISDIPEGEELTIDYVEGEGRTRYICSVYMYMDKYAYCIRIHMAYIYMCVCVCVCVYGCVEGEGRTRDEARAHLKALYGFDCKCPRCVGPKNPREEELVAIAESIPV
ncbi:hypothetical protein KIPB_003842 [Kipferlia bialata]|uniref:SET domain-containing protein n=1 Tax=Kipferlia bialata TaxID=797122 RepID=A0A9K3CTJ2_9EUKA|nr:hypothetical protein KIPB_003842 [Kipferlia bialata]|eukprot:g3842.t1